MNEQKTIENCIPVIRENGGSLFQRGFPSSPISIQIYINQMRIVDSQRDGVERSQQSEPTTTTLRSHTQRNEDRTEQQTTSFYRNSVYWSCIITVCAIEKTSEGLDHGNQKWEVCKRGDQDQREIVGSPIWATGSYQATTKSHGFAWITHDVHIYIYIYIL